MHTQLKVLPLAEDTAWKLSQQARRIEGKITECLKRKRTSSVM